MENFNGYLPYIISVGVIYAIYKYFQFEISERKASFSLFKILGFFLIHLFILCILFYSYNNLGFGNGLILFFKIIYFSFIPFSIILITLSFGKKITSYLPSIQNESDIYKFIISLGIGFFSFVFLLDIFGILGFYNLYVVFSILIGFSIFSYKELLSVFNSIFSYKFKIDIDEGSYLKLISTEFLFIVSTLVLSVSLISIVRPFPIGWDDLGVYMNHPHLMAEAGSIIALGQMYAWQTFTGIGYMFGSPTQAFFLNIVGGFLSFIVLILVVSDLFKSTGNSKIKTFINIPLLVGTIFISMPMMVFQQAKDMKLDAGLFFISVIVLYLIFKYYLKNSKENISKENSIISKIKNVASFSGEGEKIYPQVYPYGQERGFMLIILIIGLLAGFAFSIKFTSLLLISGIIGLIFFVRLGFIGFVGYLAIFFAIFTKANLWSMMNVVVNPNKIPGFETKFALISGFIGAGLLIYTFIKKSKITNKILLEIGVFLLGILIALIPWMGKNIVESYPNISVRTIISGTPDVFRLDATLIYSDDEIKKIKEEKQRERISSEGTASNEDLGRYFGYETGINNYTKLPWNLTMQINQAGEYTDIGFIFLALLPVIFLFLPFRRKEYAYLIVIILILELLVFVKVNNKLIDNSGLKNITEISKSIIFESNNTVFSKISEKNIYDINVKNYISSSDINRLVTADSTFESVNDRAIGLFYEELKTKVLDTELGKDIVLTTTSLTDNDYGIIKELRLLNINYSTFKSDIDSVVVLERIIKKNNLEAEKDILIGLWKDNRTFNQIISDFLSSFSLPFGYLIILLIFLLPVGVLLYIIDGKKINESAKIDLFKYNLIFATFYVFLWTISAFGIVWYGIIMYFSFLLSIAIGVYYLSSYTDEDSEKEFYIKGFGSLILILIVLIYIVNSVFPHSFKNLKGAGYDKYKMGQITTTDASFLYHPEYLKILFHTNIDENKREDFLNEFIDDEIKTAVDQIAKMDIYTINSILKEITGKYPKLRTSATKSLNNIYKNISNPMGVYKNKVGIYRIGTFLKYHISENNKRLLEDSLIFKFNDYIYNSNINKTVENLKKLGLGYLLVDLNAATIDKDEKHNLTSRYEKLLSTFTSDKLELIETDSVCLKLGLEEFNKSEKFSEDRTRFLTIAGVNYESYTEDGKTILRGTKLLECYKTINNLIKDKRIDNENYTYLLNISNYISQNKDKYSTDNEVYKLLQQQVTHGYKVLFRI
ncbi:MAG: hypothetical protein QM490_05890, partial [Candidatus Gracilibacteria bacterium]